MFIGLRAFLDEVDAIGELETIEGAHWDREMSAISELTSRGPRDPKPALLFDEIPDYPSGYRTVFGMTNSINRLAITVGLSPTYGSELEFLEDYRTILRDIADGERYEPEFVAPSNAPVMQNSQLDDDVDVLSFPVPFHHPGDGGRYIGTADSVITRAPDSGRVNAGTYRMQAFDSTSLGLYIAPGKYGRMDIEDHLEVEERVPVVAAFGHDPTLWMLSTMGVHHDSKYPEFGRAGGIKGEPFPVVEGPETGLPMPANAELVIEGYVERDNTRVEGPFGEWTGYYASGSRDNPVVDVVAIHHRDDPILACAVPAKPPYDFSTHKSLSRSANLWNEIEDAGVPNVAGVWRTVPGGSRLFNVVAIRQRYAGHARQTGYVAAQIRSGAFAGRWTVVVDEDIDPTNLDEVLWAMSTRCDPAEDVEFIERAWSTPLDPMVPRDEKENPFNTRAIVDATIPYERRAEFPQVAEVSPEDRETIDAEWHEVIQGTAAGSKGSGAGNRR